MERTEEHSLKLRYGSLYIDFRYMKQKFIKCSIVAIVAVVGYTAPFVVIRFAKPEIVNTNNGPKAAFKSFYYPLCYISASRPIWHSRVRDGWTEGRNSLGLRFVTGSRILSKVQELGCV